MRSVEVGFLLGQEEGAGGPQKTTNTYLTITGGVIRNKNQSEELDRAYITMFSLESDEGGARPHKGCVYSDGAIDVYFKLNNIDPSHFSKAKLDPSPNSKAKSMTQVSIGKTLNRVHPTPAKMTHLHHHEAVRVGNWQILCLLRERFFVVALLIRQISAIAIEDSPRNMILNQPRK
ncbi:hypothetical protein L195_g048319 [Trifolium pratense]|uniref:Uncharacterized protein n=2 Tax=Trifolium pratense TaxID=57577 RepID=A0A2K3JKZ1_TRIPR|nr:hypothetical protein L195_g048319 [Trifolium pratense]